MGSSWNSKEFTETAQNEAWSCSSNVMEWSGSTGEAERSMIEDMIGLGVPGNLAEEYAAEFVGYLNRVQDARQEIASAWQAMANAGEHLASQLRRHGIDEGVGFISN